MRRGRRCFGETPQLAVRGVCRREWATMSIANPVVLVVEDEWLLRLVAVELVEDAGFQALSAASADEALSILETRGDVWLLFTDVQMPGSMDGLSLAHAVRDRWPPVELIVTSGQRHIRAEDLPDRGRFFAKPYDREMLSRAFQEMAEMGQG
jgi:CheY-like chemotaxis protein